MMENDSNVVSIRIPAKGICNKLLFGLLYCLTRIGKSMHTDVCACISDALLEKIIQINSF